MYDVLATHTSTPIAHWQISVVIDGRSIVEAYTKRRLPPNFSNSPPTRGFFLNLEIAFVLLVRNGAPGGIRTPGLLVRSRSIHFAKSCQRSG
jgi:hypothetical protein